ncbi:cyclopropane-fatty-acyl-phospholipid synthase [Lysobacter helvus]|uniref:Cyclopropane-fatty-acyl-phospholipid synthase n=2 Tax=Lysobacteraceae TaxID=32033 RepID=A0ABN6FXL0_9GAMM|nr:MULTISPECIES: cyclopropane fatty acyl phospholipid synthase [Lysobacter]BCT94075.1 cyclopropane-fatty-acyl-phospholipid synthase [Lysobacter caseinilyticus]BCT97231.1 cyclopropane-fatty-acyl-phospholipid synthase [Lysobacter helvus]
MSVHPFRQRILQLLHDADVRPEGDRTGGRAPWDPRVHDEHFYNRILAQGSLGLGESYMDGWWDVDDLDGMLLRLLGHGADRKVHGLGEVWDALRARVSNLQTEHRAFEVGERHYDLGNDLYRAMLGQRLVYSCGYWREADNLDDAQAAKLDLVCRKLGLRPGMRVLDIGCGWGEALKFAAERYGIAGVGVTVSREQAEYARDLCAGLPIDIRLQDYRELVRANTGGGFDRIFSLGMFEHVGVRNYATYFDVARRCFSEDAPDGGLFLLHTIGGNLSTAITDPWIARYIFPNSMLPSPKQLTTALEGRFVIEDWHNFGTDYDRTLQAWRANVEAHWPDLPERYDERFRRMWRFYLAGAMASFRARRIQLWQLVLSPNGVAGGYIAPR